MVERLSIGEDPTPYNSMIAAEHLSRYLLACSFCKGKDVLDIACGEGYGAAYLSDSGASTVHGVDISEVAIEKANKYFRRSNTTYLCADALDFEDWNPEGKSFDLIVCFETIEHVRDPELLLLGLKRLLRPNGAILISCPDDSYENALGIYNPYHCTTYSLPEFKKITTSVLGNPTQWLVGTPLTGIVLLEDNSSFLKNEASNLDWTTAGKPVKDALLLPTQPEHYVGESGASFYLGIWNGVSSTTAVAAPISKPALLNLWVSLQEERTRANALSQSEGELQRKLEELKSLLNQAEQRARLHRRLAEYEMGKLRLKTGTPPPRAVANVYDPASRAHRLASLYVTSAQGNNLLLKLGRFSIAVFRVLVRRLKKRLSGIFYTR